MTALSSRYRAQAQCFFLLVMGQKADLRPQFLTVRTEIVAGRRFSTQRERQGNYASFYFCSIMYLVGIPSVLHILLLRMKLLFYTPLPVVALSWGVGARRKRSWQTTAKPFEKSLCIIPKPNDLFPRMRRQMQLDCMHFHNTVVWNFILL